MPRNISFYETQGQFLDRSKDVTRRLGWKFVKSGDVLCGVKKAQGIPKGGKIERLGLIEVISVRREPLSAITANDVRREGFPDWTPAQFIAFFSEFNKCGADEIVTRIEFGYLD